MDSNASQELDIGMDNDNNNNEDEEMAVGNNNNNNAVDEEDVSAEFSRLINAAQAIDVRSNRSAIAGVLDEVTRGGGMDTQQESLGLLDVDLMGTQQPEKDKYELCSTALVPQRPNPVEVVRLSARSFPILRQFDLKPVVTNCTAIFNAGPEAKLNLKKIAMSCKNSEYNPKRFAAVVLRLREPKCTALLFESGKVILAGAYSMEQAKLGGRKVCKILKKLDYNVKFVGFRVYNMVAVCNLRQPIRLESFAGDNPQSATYEPDIFPGAVFKMLNPKCTVLVFVTGKIVVTGAKSTQDIFQACENLFPVLRKYMKAPAEAKK